MPEPVFPSDDVLKQLVNDQSAMDKILQAALRAVYQAGVLQTQSDDGTQAMPHLTLRVADGELLINNLETRQKLTWDLAGSAVPEAVAKALADALVAVLNSPPANIKGGRWGWHKNVEKAADTKKVTTAAGTKNAKKAASARNAKKPAGTRNAKKT